MRGTLGYYLIAFRDLKDEIGLCIITLFQMTNSENDKTLTKIMSSFTKNMNHMIYQ